MNHIDLEGFVLLLVIANVFFSYKGFKEASFYEKYLFDVDAILIGKEYIRLLSAGFLHANWKHLLFNMISLVAFGFSVGYALGPIKFLIIYFGSLIAGCLLSLYFHRNHGDYRAVGASGAISGVIFSSIALFPESHISFMFLPMHIPAWFFGICYLLISIYGIKSQFGNTGHEAHVGGAIAGILISIGLEPSIFAENTWVILGMLLPFIVFMTVVLKKPEFMLVENYVSYQKQRLNEYDRAHKEFKDEQELNRLLEKVQQNGLESLSRRERKNLDLLAKNL
jgi:membrane associated rhomboid family serine protease